MRSVNLVAGEDTQCYLIELAGEAGGELANLNRWRGEVGHAPLDAAGLAELERVEFLGTSCALLGGDRRLLRHGWRRRRGPYDPRHAPDPTLGQRLPQDGGAAHRGGPAPGGLPGPVRFHGTGGMRDLVMNTSKRALRRASLTSLVLTVSLATSSNALPASTDPVAKPDPVPSTDTTGRSDPWGEDVMELFRSLPVQDGGRIKPLDSLAGLRLLTLNGKRTLKLEDETKLSSIEWLLDCLFYPEQARDYPCFRVQNSAVLTAVGMEPKEKRDWYSYRELEPFIGPLFQEASAHARIDAKQQTPVQAQTLKLATDLRSFEELVTLLDPLRASYSTHSSAQLEQVFEGMPEGTLATILSRAPELAEYSRSPERGTGERGHLPCSPVHRAGGIPGDGRAVVPAAPPEGAEDQDRWWSVLDVARPPSKPTRTWRSRWRRSPRSSAWRALRRTGPPSRAS